MQAVKARSALAETAAHFQELRDPLASGHTGTAREVLIAAQDSAASARRNTRGPGWWIASKLPGIGDDVAGVRTVAEVADDLASDVLPGVVDVGGTLSPDELRPKNGRIDVDAIARVAPAVEAADDDMQRARGRVAGLEPDDMVGPVARPVASLQDKLGEAADLTAKASRAVQLLPPMLGAEEKRTYLVLFQNNAEVRATGGIPGAFSVITAEDGRIRMGKQGDAGDLDSTGKPVLPLTAEERALFDTQMAVYPQDVNFTPDFPRSAELAQAMWERAEGVRVDGVLSADPVALSYLLQGTGPVPLPGGQTLTAQDAVPALLNTIYLEQPDPELQNEFFAAAARAVFDAVSTGAGDPARVLEGMARAASEQRLMVWSDESAEQDLIAPTPLSGALATGESERPHIGVFFNDGTGAKMDYYVERRVDVRSVSCPNDAQNLEVTVTMRSNAPADSGSLPEYVTGPAFSGPPGTVSTGVLVYAPTGGRIGSGTLNGDEFEFATATHEGRPVASQAIELAPGDEVTLEFAVSGDEGQTGDVDLRVTPGVHDTGVGTVGPTSCS